MDQIKIAICDPNSKSRVFYEDYCRSLGKKHSIPLLCKDYSSYEALLKNMESPDFCEFLDILFIEIDFPGANGSEVTKSIRETGYCGVIVFLSDTKSGEYYEDIFDVMAFNFVRKGEEKLARFERIFLKAIQAAGEMHREYLILNCAGEYRQIAISDISHFEVRAHMVFVFYGGKSFEFYSSLNKLENQLYGRGFFRAHKSFLVSQKRVERLSGYEILMMDGTVIPIGRKYSQNVREIMKARRT